MAGTNVNDNQPTFPYMVGLNLQDLKKLINDHIWHHATWPTMPTKLLSDIPIFDSRAREDPSNHIVSFHLWCSSNSIMEESIRLMLFQCTLTVSTMKWYIDKPTHSHATFESITKVFLALFQFFVHRDVGINILTNFHQNTTTHIIYHIHECHRQCDLCRVEINDRFLMEYFLKLLLPPIVKDVSMMMPKNEEESIQKEQ
jgi:hypothetical protein